MSFGTTHAQPLPQQKPFNVAEDRLDTNEMGRPVPYVAGTAQVGITFISDAFNVTTEPVERSVGKKDQVTGYIYYASFAAVLCMGPVDSLRIIKMDDEVVWTGAVFRGPEDYVDITIENRGQMRFYWGTQTQGVDPLLAASAPETHSAYRGLCYAVFDSLRFGENRTAAPQIEFVVGRFPKPSWMAAATTTGSGGFGGSSNGMNAVAVLWDVWTNHRFGLGQPEARLDEATLTATADVLAAENLGLGLVISRAVSFRQFLTQLLEHVDGYPTLDAEGRLGIALRRGAPAVEATLTVDALVKAPEFDSIGWDQTFNETKLTYSPEGRDYKSDAVSYRDRANFQITRGMRSQTISRPWITRPALAQGVCDAFGRASAIPRHVGRILARRSKVAALDAGSILALTFPSLGLEAMRFQVTSKTENPTSAEVEMRIEEDLGFLNARHFEPDEPAEPSQTISEGAALAYNDYEEAPYALSSERLNPESVWALWLAVRGDQLSTGFTSHRQLGSGSYESSFFHNRFAQRAHFAAAYGAGTLVIDEAGFEIIYDSLDNSFPEEISEAQALENEVLLLTAGGEIMSGFGAELVSAGRYRVGVVRARFDTVRQAHAADEGIYIVRRSARTMEQIAFGTSAQNWKLQPRFLNVDRDLSLCPVVAVTPISRAFRPLAPLNLRVFDDGAHPAYTTGQDIVAQWDSPAAQRGMRSQVDSAVYPAVETHVKAEIRTLADALQGTFTLPAVGNEFTITNAELAAALGGQTDFVLRVWLVRDGYTSLFYDQITVRQV